jgi:hypothetical protein
MPEPQQVVSGNFLKKNNQNKVGIVVFFPIFSCCSYIGDQPVEDLAKSGYKTNREI